MPLEVLLVDVALALIALGFACVVRPLRILRIRSRRLALLTAGAGIILLGIGLSLPVRPAHLPGPRMAIDDVLPAYQFGEHHEILVAAPPERVLAAARTVTAREIRLFRLLTWLRAPHLPGRGRASILNPDADLPLLDVALRSGFVLLKDEPEREIVFGAVVCCSPRHPPRSAEEFAALQGSLARAVMNFYVEPSGGGTTRLVTETRVAASDARAERVFARYWRMIYPGSAVIRIMWLRAIRARAEAATATRSSRATPPAAGARSAA